MRRMLIVTAVALVGILVAGQGAALADTGPVLAQWSMDERPGAEVMVDSSGNGFAGGVGDEVTTGVALDGSTTYVFERLKPNTPPARPEHNVIVAHDPRLNPGSRSLYVIEVRLRTGNRFANVLQKGQATSKGGYWKIQIPQGEPSCLFRGPGGVTNAVRARGLPINDNQWHTIRCEATPDEVRLYVDGAFIGRNRGLTGPIANTQVLSVGGKSDCDQISITCDYFGGHIDYVRLEARG